MLKNPLYDSINSNTDFEYKNSIEELFNLLNFDNLDFKKINTQITFLSSNNIFHKYIKELDYIEYEVFISKITILQILINFHDTNNNELNYRISDSLSEVKFYLSEILKNNE